jgi:hypothetical protein
MIFPLITRIRADWMLQNPQPSALLRPNLPFACARFVLHNAQEDQNPDFYKR